jgi:putative tricarboxylic transport membrane protein
MGKKEIVIGIVLMLLSATLFALTYQFPKQTLALSPKVFPRFVSTCLFLLATILALQGLAGIRHKHSEQPTTTAFVDKKFMMRFILIILLAFGYTRILPWLGYLLSTPFFVAGTMLIFNEKRWLWVITVSVMTSIFLYVVFRMIFRVPLPRFNL